MRGEVDLGPKTSRGRYTPGQRWVAFSGLAPGATAHNILVYNLSTNNVYQVSNTVGDNQLNDITVNPDGTVRIAWQVQNSNLAIYAFSFRSSVEFAASPHRRPST